MITGDAVDIETLTQRIERVRLSVAKAAIAAARDPDEITLVAVCKGVGRAVVDAAYRAGLRHFGENRVQEATAKFAEPLPGDASLHMIGQLQTNKCVAAVRAFSIIESVDRPSLIAELDKQAAKLDVTMPALLQVNVAREAQKAGCNPAEAELLVTQLVRAEHVLLRGLMTIAPLVEDAELARPVFQGLRELRERLTARFPTLDLPVLSMGMSNDFAVAIEEGATHIRVGRAIFGG